MTISHTLTLEDKQTTDRSRLILQNKGVTLKINKFSLPASDKKL